ncbi:MAG TPA: VWA domain-containing protein [Anaerolineaceae bacterium]|nr:VWA domain-containing protein [Anaerolineaceae bacterium]
MDQRIVQFIAALRASGVRISLAESADAFKATETLGVMDKEAFKFSLMTTLVKEARDQENFEKLFPLFFDAGSPPEMNDPSQGLTPEEAQMIAQALREYTSQMRRMMEKLLEGRPLSPQELNQLDRLTRMDDVNDLRMQNMKARQMEQALRFDEVREALEELMKMLQEMGMDKERVQQLNEAMKENQDALEQQVRQHVGQKIGENISQQNLRDREDGLYNRPFQQMSDSDMQELRQQVRRMAAVMRTRLALRLKRAKSGKLDVKSTLRTNMKYGSVPVEIRHRDQTLKPKIVVLCDVSTSMRHVSEMMLTLLYEIQDQISKTHAFAFIDHLEHISPYFTGHQASEAVSDVLQRMPSGHYNTDLGSSLDTLTKDYMEIIDSRSTFIIVGDGRNNYNDPRLDLFANIARRARSAIWLNPEPMAMWGVGDSDMLKYSLHCKRTFQVSNMAQLAGAIDNLLVQP